MLIAFYLANILRKLYITYLLMQLVLAPLWHLCTSLRWKAGLVRLKQSQGTKTPSPLTSERSSLNNNLTFDHFGQILLNKIFDFIK